ncbi:hypothetical protein FUT69_03170 [Xylella taiwanensis]|uniref:hypothetical protein n=1 Tax=Xylella taiwanensis TaxID=1444770 RepID=UPI0012685CD6|nr:hypothetical protein [Xylella taiwanensis]MCD8459391.1 hypothetical protein [Xylella taiwanensis]NBI36238.1 hypothetical protein [Xylella taiwanensis]UFN07114.1 hypothetical protein LPH42_01660 [Xylella taiwanensis]UFN09413.1 hypothetical protein LPH45_01695 [Xylella taiwanensis]UFN10691.1 hypothetical protein LPH44_08045 [Xylella taiwanensis]
MKVDLDGTDASSKYAPPAIGKPITGGIPSIPFLRQTRAPSPYFLSPGQVHDVPEGGEWLSRLAELPVVRAHGACHQTHPLTLDSVFIHVALPLRTRIEP